MKQELENSQSLATDARYRRQVADEPSVAKQICPPNQRVAWLTLKLNLGVAFSGLFLINPNEEILFLSNIGTWARLLA